MNSITIKGIRQQVENEDGKNYSDEKVFFSEIIQKIITEPQQAQQKEEYDDDDDDFDHETVGQSVDDDYELALHLQQQEENAGKKSLRRRQASVLKKYTDGNIHIAKKTKGDGEDAGKKSRAPNNRLNKPMLMSEELQNLLGNQWIELSRPETVKQIWIYIKEHNLQDPADKRFIVGDEKFVAVFKKPKISCFAMNKVLSSHLFRNDDSIVSDRQDSIAESDISSTERPSKKRKTAAINRRLLMIPGVTEDMPLEVMQATILNYTKSTKLRHPEDPDLVRIVQGSPIFDMLGCPSDQETINIAQLISKINDMYNGLK